MLRRVFTSTSRRAPFSSSIRNYQANIDASQLVIEKIKTPKEKTPNDQLVFGHTFTDHMLTIDWDATKGWHAPQIVPYGDMKLSPASSALHYAIQCFEGMKAYKTANGDVRLFRPNKNMDRLNSSMTRLAMPPIDGNDAVLELIKELIRVDSSWVPSEEGYSLYIRPAAIGTSPYLGVHASEQVKLFVILCPVGPYYKSGFKPVKLFADAENVRAWPGGAGNAKVGGNYAPTIKPSAEAAEKHGCSQILWLFGENHEITEVGAMNMFFALRKPDGRTELVTPPLTRGDILPGVTRDSVLSLARTWGDVDVVERFITIGEVQKAAKEGTLLEAFGTGTAAVISPVNCIVYNGEDIVIPTGDSIGPLAKKAYSTLRDIQYGVTEHEWSVPV